jgi:hypothetical protein
VKLGRAARALHTLIARLSVTGGLPEPRWKVTRMRRRWRPGPSRRRRVSRLSSGPILSVRFSRPFTNTWIRVIRIPWNPTRGPAGRCRPWRLAARRSPRGPARWHRVASAPGGTSAEEGGGGGGGGTARCRPAPERAEERSLEQLLRLPRSLRAVTTSPSREDGACAERSTRRSRARGLPGSSQRRPRRRSTGTRLRSRHLPWAPWSVQVDPVRSSSRP